MKTRSGKSCWTTAPRSWDRRPSRVPERGDRHLDRAVSIGVDRRLNEDTLSMLVKLQKRAARFLKPGDTGRWSFRRTRTARKTHSSQSSTPCSTTRWQPRRRTGLDRQERSSHQPPLRTAPVACHGIDRCASPAGCAIEHCLCGECMLCLEHCPRRQ